MHIYGIVMSTGGTKRKGKEGWGGGRWTLWLGLGRGLVGRSSTRKHVP